MLGTFRNASINPARRLALRILGSVMLVQTVVFVTAGAGYLFWYERSVEEGVESRVLAPGRLIQQGQMPHSAISDRDKLQSVVGTGLVDALLVGANGNIFEGLDPTDLGKQVGSIDGIDTGWFRKAGTNPLVTRMITNGRSQIISVTPLLTLDNIAPFLYVYVKLDTTSTENERARMRAATISAVLFAIIATTVVIYLAFELILFRRVRKAAHLLGQENGDNTTDFYRGARASDEMELVEIGLQKMAEDRQRQRSLRAEAETALVEVTAKHEASVSAVSQAKDEVRRARSLIEAVPDGLVTVGPDLAVLTCNETAARRLGRSQAEIVGRQIGDFLQSPEASGDPWPEVGTHRALCGNGFGDEIEIVVGAAEGLDGHRAIFLREAVDQAVRHELDLLSQSIGEALRLTPGQWQSVGERLAMLREYLADLEGERRIVSKALDAMPLAVSVVDANGLVRFANRLAEQLLELKDGLLILQGRLAATRSADNALLRQRIREVAGSQDQTGGADWSAMRVERDNGTAWFISVAPLGQIAQSDAPELVIVLISDPNIPTKPSASMLRQLHGLTYAESEILTRMTVGATLADIAAELGVSVGTVRTHLKAIFAKTGTSRQADVVRHAVVSGVMLQVTHARTSDVSNSEPRLIASLTREKSTERSTKKSK